MKKKIIIIASIILVFSFIVIGYIYIKEQVNNRIIMKDTKNPIILFKEEICNVSKGVSFDPSSNIDSVNDDVDGMLHLSSELKENTYIINSNVNVNREGKYKVSVTGMDKHHNKTTKSYEVVVESTSLKTSNIIGTSDSVKPTYIKGVLIVNKTYGIPRDFRADDKEAIAALSSLQQGANAAGYTIPLISAYRSYETQTKLYNDYVAKDGKEAADRYSAQPGYSEHQTGLGFDVGAIEYEYGDRVEGTWLKENCAKYGFIIRYPRGKEDITGYMHEPWHIRFVGEDIAKKIMNADSTLEQYLGV